MTKIVKVKHKLENFRSVLVELGSLFNNSGYRLYLVGGPIRDALLGKSIHDLDFTTEAKPEIIKSLLKNWADNVWDPGIEFGTISAKKNSYHLEITTFRSDTYDKISRNPKVKLGVDITQDLARRDFTINAIAVEITSQGIGELLDPLNGLLALNKGIIDTPLLPGDSFNDDPLRMLRAARFAAQLNFEISERVIAALQAQRADILRITPERIREELDKLILTPHPVKGLEVLVASGLAELILPELPNMRLTMDENHQHKDVYKHSLQVLQQVIGLETSGPDLVLRWAALLHDIGKPATRKFEPNYKVSFHHHEVVGAKLARARLKKLKYSNKFIDDVTKLIFLHLRFHGYGEQKWSDTAVRRYVTDAGDLLTRLHKLVRADCTTRNQTKTLELHRRYDDLENRIAELAAKENLKKMRPALNGHEIKLLLNLSDGPLVGKAWNYLMQIRLNQGEISKTTAAELLKKWWNEFEINSNH